MRLDQFERRFVMPFIALGLAYVMQQRGSVEAGAGTDAIAIPRLR